jgi:hypothetical protein
VFRLANPPRGLGREVETVRASAFGGDPNHIKSFMCRHLPFKFLAGTADLSGGSFSDRLHNGAGQGVAGVLAAR